MASAPMSCGHPLASGQTSMRSAAAKRSTIGDSRPTVTRTLPSPRSDQWTPMTSQIDCRARGCATAEAIASTQLNGRGQRPAAGGIANAYTTAEKADDAYCARTGDLSPTTRRTRCTFAALYLIRSRALSGHAERARTRAQIICARTSGHSAVGTAPDRRICLRPSTARDAPNGSRVERFGRLGEPNGFRGSAVDLSVSSGG
jgi:hypothetical protein